MKKVLCLVISVLLCLTFVACGQENNNNEENEEQNMGYVFKEREIKTDGKRYQDGVDFPDELWETPEFEYCPDLDFGTSHNVDVSSVKGIFYTSPIKYKGKKTKIAAYIGFPEGASKDNKVPAIVLVHGGLGTACPDWVKYWNDLGFAAISMDTEGAEPVNGVSNYNNVHIEQNRYKDDETYTNGPTNTGIAKSTVPLEDNWYYHATSSVIVATSLISSFECVDTQKVGITGVSWGGMITSVVTGYDDRLTFSVPVYGSTSLNNSCSGFATIYPDSASIELWDTTKPLENTNCKMFFVNGTRDFAFSMDASSRCAYASKGYAVYKKNFNHGQVEGAYEPDIPFFAKYICGMSNEFVEIVSNPTKDDPSVTIYAPEGVVVESVKIVYTSSFRTNKSAVWESKRVDYETGKTTYDLEIPEETKYYYIDIIYNSNLQVSSCIVTL